MEIKKLLEVLNKRLDDYSKKLKELDDSIIKEIYNIRASELRMCILDVCAWYSEELSNIMKDKIKTRGENNGN